MLVKSLYDLKQAPRLWNKTLNKVIVEGGIPVRCIRSTEDEYLYIRKNLTVLIYVDDILLFLKSKETINTVKEALMKKFKMTNVREVKKFLGIRVTRDREAGTIRLDQENYCK